MTQKVWIYVDTSKKVGDDYLKVFATEEIANEWLEQHDDEGVAFAYPVIERPGLPSPEKML